MRALRTAVLAVLLAGTAILWGGTSVRADLADDLINELICPSCGTVQPLATSATPEAAWMRDFIRAKVAEGWSRQRIVDTLVRQYGERILGVPAKEGFSLAAWVAPFATIFGGAAVVGLLLTGWLRERQRQDAYLDAEMARAIDDDDLRRYESRLADDLARFE